MASDEESTQPIDIAALREAQARDGADEAKRAERGHTVATPSSIPQTTDLPSFGDGAPASITRVDLLGPTIEVQQTVLRARLQQPHEATAFDLVALPRLASAEGEEAYPGEAETVNQTDVTRRVALQGPPSVHDEFDTLSIAVPPGIVVPETDPNPTTDVVDVVDPRQLAREEVSEEEVLEEEAEEVLDEEALEEAVIEDEAIVLDSGEAEFLLLDELAETRVPNADYAHTDVSLLPGKALAPAAPAYRPPAPAKPLLPFEVDPDSDERQLQREESFSALIELYRMRLASAATPLEKTTLLLKIASVHEHRLDAPERAFSALEEAFELRPGDEDVATALDRLGRRVGRIEELVSRARRNLHTADPELRIILLGHIVYWLENHLGRPEETAPLVMEIERLDKSHPVTLRRGVHAAMVAGDTKTARELLVRSLERATRRDERVALYLALAHSHAGTPDEARHVETAVGLDHGSIPALRELERLGRAQEKHAQVEWALDRQIEAASSDEARVPLLLALAELQEKKFLRREKAAEILESVLELDGDDAAALQGLERCYHALRDWPKLAKVLRTRARRAPDEKTRIELLDLVSEVYGAKLGDVPSAIAARREQLLIDPEHRRALGDLARIYEKQSDWRSMAIYRARLAELAATKRMSSQLFVQLGDFLAAPDRDPGSAIPHYERAVELDPTNGAAWEAQQKHAYASGDLNRVAKCLEQRAKNVEAPRQRGAIYVELAQLHRQRGDESAAHEAFEAAAKADPTNETAAEAVLDSFIRGERWAEAAPLCETLIAAATREKRKDALFTRLRLQTRISAALGNADKAMTSSLAATDLRPEDASAQSDLIMVCSQCRNAPRVVARARKMLTRIGEHPDGLPAPVLIRLAQLQRDVNDVKGAARSLTAAFGADPENADVLRELADVQVELGNYAVACGLKLDLARNTPSADARFQLLLETGEIWAKKAQDPARAASVYEEARKLKPLDNVLLHALMLVYVELEAWDALSGVLAAISTIQESPERKVKSLLAMAQVVAEKVRDLGRAADLFDQILDIDKKRLDVFEQLVRVMTEAKDWEGLERAYRKMIARVRHDDEALRFALFSQLGLIYRDRLEDAERAYEAMEAAARLRPDDPAVRKIVTELLVITDELDRAVARTRDLLERDPHDAELYAELYELFLRQHYFDKAWCTVNVLASMRELTPEQRRFHDDYAPVPLQAVPGQIVEHAWRSHVLSADLDPTLTTLFARMTPVVARMRHAQLRPEQLVHAVGRPFTPAHSQLHDQIRATFANAAEILSLGVPDLLLGDPGSPVLFAPALAPFGAILVSPKAVEARADSLVYVVGKRLAEQRPELAARAFFPSISDLTILLAAAVRVSRNEGASDAAGAAFDASLAAIMTPDEREAIRAIVTQATMEGSVFDVKRWSQAADVSSTRAGLLLAGDVRPARRVMLSEPQSTADLPPRERIAELYRFATSDLYSDLRGAIGVSIQEE
ncbi:TPR domain protein, putative component of TonB system [Labilithrix luteola]|uniref:TPR domain protein, putative component of TonB system n=1 Tax=Labilithrix luteola TaxID=1391654 RepID=A0A0K1Q1D7_9BACT|nr:hypothetical protein [Labilithrix luteola]AKU99204.1 TPR domain protein, putative component of TonB system [Labilithrix luteola]